MGKIIFIPEQHLMFLALEQCENREVSLVKFERFKEQFRLTIKNQFRGTAAFIKDEKAEKDIYLEKGLIKTSEKEGFYNRCIKYKSEIIENIQNTYNLNYFHALEVWTSVLQNWTNSLKG